MAKRIVNLAISFRKSYQVYKKDQPGGKGRLGILVSGQYERLGLWAPIDEVHNAAVEFPRLLQMLSVLGEN